MHTRVWLTWNNVADITLAVMQGDYPLRTPKTIVWNSEPVTVTSRPRNIRWSARGLGHHTSDTTHDAHDLTRLGRWSNFWNSVIIVIFLRVTVVFDGFPLIFGSGDHWEMRGKVPKPLMSEPPLLLNHSAMVVHHRGQTMPWLPSPQSRPHPLSISISPSHLCFANLRRHITFYERDLYLTQTRFDLCRFPGKYTSTTTGKLYQ